MKLNQWKNICLVVCAFVFSNTLFAAEQPFDDATLIAQQKQTKKTKKSNSNRNVNRDPNTWTPYYQHTKSIEPVSNFYQQNVGIGFLYFSGINGNLNLVPSNVPAGFAISPPKSNRKLLGHIGYNRTPVAEFIIGRDIYFWLKLAMSYTHQGGVWIQTRPQAPSTTNNGINPDLTAALRLDAAMVKAYFMCPWTLVWKNYYYEPYLALGVGPGWQSWTNIKVNGANSPTTMRAKFSANCVFTIDMGAKLRKAMPTYVMSFTLGCKFTDWGQARSMGKINNQYNSSAILGGTSKQAFTNPLRITTVYKFAPYVGVQFNF